MQDKMFGKGWRQMPCGSYRHWDRPGVEIVIRCGGFVELFVGDIEVEDHDTKVEWFKRFGLM